MSVTEVQGLAGQGFVPGADKDYEEVAFPNPSFQFQPGDPMPIVKRYHLYKYSQLQSFLAGLLGWPFFVPGTPGTMGRNLPEMISTDFFTAVVDPSNSDGWLPNYFCTKILSCLPEKPINPNPLSVTVPSDPEDIDSFPTMAFSDGLYERFVIDALFEQPLYDIDFSADISTEADRYCYIRERTIQKSANINGTNQICYFDGLTGSGATGPFSNPIGSTISRPLVDENVIVDWLQVPVGAFNENRIKSFYSCVNNAVFEADENAYATGTLLFQGYNKNYRRHQLGFFVYDLQFIFLYINQLSDAAHGSVQLGANCALTKQGTFQGLTTNLTTKTPYFKSQNFSNLFLP